MKNSKKLEIINHKIEELSKLQKDIETQMIDSVSKQIATVLIKKRAFGINIPAFLKRIEKITDEMNGDK